MWESLMVVFIYANQPLYGCTMMVCLWLQCKFMQWCATVFYYTHRIGGDDDDYGRYGAFEFEYE